MERRAFLPHGLLLPDMAVTIPEPPTRADEGLPEDAFVFCAFNQLAKISEPVFRIWMQLLRRVPDSVLWLSPADDDQQANLRSAARRRGVGSHRLIFASHRDNATHIARHQLADLYVDAFDFSAHTTACDALRMGLPMVTRRGEEPYSRIGASLVSSAGLGELVTQSPDEYFDLALALTHDHARRRSLA